jgi:RNA polymerase sigma-70 factor (ECF subfamily)
MYDRHYRFFSWIYRISVNEALNHVERYSRNTELMDDKMESSISPEEGASGSDIREMIDDALMEMELDYRVLIVLRHFHDLSYREMAYVVDIPEKKVKSRLFAARQILKERLIKKGIDFHG